MSLKTRIFDARASLSLAAASYKHAANECERLLRELPEGVDNMPADVCAVLLRSVGFAVLHRDHLEQALGVVAETEGDDIDERVMRSKLLIAMKDELAKVRT